MDIFQKSPPTLNTVPANIITKAVDSTSSMDTQGPCLPWCFSYKKYNYLFIGFVIGFFLAIFIIKFLESRRSNKQIKRIRNDSEKLYLDYYN
jgi:hypothetical protein